MKVASEAPARATSPPDGAGPAEETSPARWVVAAAALVIVAGIVVPFAPPSDLWLDEGAPGHNLPPPLRGNPRRAPPPRAPPPSSLLFVAAAEGVGTSH